MNKTLEKIEQEIKVVRAMIALSKTEPKISGYTILLMLAEIKTTLEKEIKEGE